MSRRQHPQKRKKLDDSQVVASAAQNEADAAEREAALNQEAIEQLESENMGSAIHQYERLLSLYPDYAGNDRVMYQLARAYELKWRPGEKQLGVLNQLCKIPQ